MLSTQEVQKNDWELMEFVYEIGVLITELRDTESPPSIESGLGKRSHPGLKLVLESPCF